MKAPIFSGLVAAAAVAYAKYTTGACDALAKAYPADLKLPSTPDYETLNAAWATNTQLSPPCIFAPRTAGAAAFALQAVAKHNTVFSVQSGGHSLNKGVSSTADGVVISLSQFREISLDKVAGTVRIGSGNRWGHVYDTLAEHGYAVPGGRVGPVGVGGLSLGGGLSYFLYSHGFVCDSIVEYEVVTAGGRVLAVTAASHPDLFVALKGSGAPFVLVTSFVFRLVEIDRSGRAYGGAVRSDGSTVPAVLRAVADFNAPGGGVDDTASHVFALSTYGAVSMAAVHLFYRWPQAAPPPALQGLVAAGSPAPLSSTLGNRTLTSIAGDVPADDGFRQTVSSLTAVDPSADDLLRIDEIAREEVAAANLGPQVIAMFVWVPCGPFAEGPNARNVLGLVKAPPVEDGGPPQRRYMELGFGLGWTDPGQDAPVGRLASRVIKRSKEYLASVGHLSPFVYMNYASLEQDPIASFGEENVERIRRARDAYDPDQLWARLRLGGFKIPARAGDDKQRKEEL